MFKMLENNNRCDSVESDVHSASFIIIIIIIIFIL